MILWICFINLEAIKKIEWVLKEDQLTALILIKCKNDALEVKVKIILIMVMIISCCLSADDDDGAPRCWKSAPIA